MADGPKPKIIVEDGWGPNPKVRVLRSETDEQRQKAVENLRDVLAQAEQGKVVDLMIITFSSPTSYSLLWSNVTAESMPRMVGALHIMAGIIQSLLKIDVTPNKPPPPQGAS